LGHAVTTQTHEVRKVSHGPHSASTASIDQEGRIRALLGRAAHLDPSPFVISGAIEVLRREVAHPLAAVVEAALAVVADLESSLEPPPHADQAADIELAFDLVGEPGQDAAGEEPSCDAEILRLCFGARHELVPVRGQLEAQGASHEQLLVACDRARRKLRRSLVALGEARARADGRSFGAEDDATDAVQGAVAVRYLYAKFGEALGSCSDDAPINDVHGALRRAATAFAMLFGDPDFAEVRVADRMLLQGLQRRTLAWGRSPDRREGLRLYGDIRSAGQLLRAINLRQELQAHDAALLIDLQAELDACTALADSGRLERVAGRMRALRGLDDALDDLLRRIYGGTPLPTLLPALRREVRRLARFRPTPQPPPSGLEGSHG
jgi:hypothetical protein